MRSDTSRQRTFASNKHKWCMNASKVNKSKESAKGRRSRSPPPAPPPSTSLSYCVGRISVMRGSFQLAQARKRLRHVSVWSRLRSVRGRWWVLFVVVFVGMVVMGGLMWKRGKGRDDEWEEVVEDPVVDVKYDVGLVKKAREKWKTVDAKDYNGHWEKVKDDVVIGIKTGHEVAKERLQRLKRWGWYSVGRDIPNLLVVSDATDVELGVVGVKGYGSTLLNGSLPERWFERGGWYGDKDKNLPMVHLLRSVFPKKKWYLVLDDDTYIFLDNFAKYISEQGLSERAVYTGKVFYISKCGGFERDGTYSKNRSEPRGMFAHGGSGIVMSGQAVEKMAPKVSECIREYGSCWAGDMQIALCLRKVGVIVRRHGGASGYERDFIPFWPSKALSDKRYISRWRSYEEPITFHKIPDHEMNLMSAFDGACARANSSVAYTPLREYLLSNGILPDHTEHNKQLRWYTTEFMPPHLK